MIPVQRGTALSGTNQIIKLGLEARANTLRSSTNPEYGVRDIARILSEESGQTVNFQSVQRYFTRNKDPVIQKVQQRTEVVAAAVQERLDTVKQMRNLNDKALALIDAVEGDPSIASRYLLLAAMREVRGQLELQAKLLGDLPTQPTINITVVEAQFNDFRNVILEVTCPDCRARISERLRQHMGA
jgi:hypothetical protein